MNHIIKLKTAKQLKMCLGMVNFYHHMFLRQSPFLVPLNRLASKKDKDWSWGASEQKYFDESKQMLTDHATLAFRDFNLTFDLYTNDSDRQLGATLLQNGKPLGFYTRKLNYVQLNYTVQEKELLGIIEGFSASKGVIRSQKLTVHTDHLNHLNILYQRMPSQCMV